MQLFAWALKPINVMISRTAHAQFARARPPLPLIVAVGHTAFGTVLLAENNPKAAVSGTEPGLQA